MALINCPECNHQVSDEATICPNCGYPLYKNLNENTKKKDVEKRNRHDLLIIVALALVISVGVIVSISNNSKTNEKGSTNNYVNNNKTTTVSQLTSLPTIYYDIFVKYSSRINNNSYSYNTVLAELHQTDYAITDNFSTTHSVWVRDNTGFFVL